MDFDEEFDKEFDEELDEDFDEDLDEDLDEDFDEPTSKSPPDDVKAKTPEAKIPSEGKKISVFFLSTIGPGEKKQKLLVFTGNKVGDIKETVANLFALDPSDFHLSSGGVTMDETSFLSDYNVAEGDDILLIPASVAG
ncbi:MAG: ubiquitin-like domain-containing protein [Candidatus Hermodarchaeota archaeon]